jgi:hypothetical protein
MQDVDGEAADAQRALDAHVAAMEAAAVVVEDILADWSQQWCQSTIDNAAARDVHLTDALRAGSGHAQFAEEAAQLQVDLPALLREGLRKTAWRHRFVDARRDGTANIMSDLDYGIWQHSGYKIPPAYEGSLSDAFSRVTQLLRKYGYRREFGSMAADHRYSAPPGAVPPMEAYYRLSTRLSETVATAEQARRQAARKFTDTAWDRE